MGAGVGTMPAVVTSYEEFYAAARPGALRLAALLTQERDAVEDLVQDAFSKVYRHWSRLDSPTAYLRAVLVNNVRTAHRQAVRERDRLARLGPCGSTALHADEIADALAALPYRQRATLVLCFYEDLAEREIAQILDCRIGTVKSLKSRALARLREAIDQ
jgi:DNA-directed RNA polymerase specialized sigma24 family protein